MTNYTFLDGRALELKQAVRIRQTSSSKWEKLHRVRASNHSFPLRAHVLSERLAQSQGSGLYLWSRQGRVEESHSSLQTCTTLTLTKQHLFHADQVVCPSTVNTHTCASVCLWYKTMNWSYLSDYWCIPTIPVWLNQSWFSQCGFFSFLFGRSGLFWGGAGGEQRATIW